MTTYNVGLHTYGGSAGEAMDPQALVNVATLEEAEAIVKAIKTHPANTHGDLGGVITEVKDTKKLPDAMAEIFQAWPFEDWEWDGCESLTDEEYEAEQARRTMEHITKVLGGEI